MTYYVLVRLLRRRRRRRRRRRHRRRRHRHRRRLIFIITGFVSIIAVVSVIFVRQLRGFP